MKTKSALRSFLYLAGSSLLVISHICAGTLYWDANDVTAGQTDGAGGWLDVNHWWTGSANTNWTSTESAVFGYSTAGGAVTLGWHHHGRLARLNPFTGTYTLGTSGAGNTITLNNGITKSSGAGVVTISSPLTLGSAQTWTNNSSTNINLQGATILGRHNLTIDGFGIVLILPMTAWRHQRLGWHHQERNRPTQL